MTKNALGSITNETPVPAHRAAHHRNLVARRQHVRDIRRQPDTLGDPLPQPGNALLSQSHTRILRDVLNIGKPLVDGIPFRLKIHEVAARLRHLGEGMVHLLDEIAQVKFLAQVVSGISDRAAGVFLLGVAQQVGGKTDLCFHLLFAIAKIIVGDQSDHYAGSVTASHLESAAVVVAFLLRVPAHAVAFLTLGGLGDMRQSQFFFAEQNKVRCKHHAPGVAGPVRRIERCVVLAEVRIAGVAKNRLHEIQVGNQAARRKKTGLE